MSCWYGTVWDCCRNSRAGLGHAQSLLLSCLPLLQIRSDYTPSRTLLPRSNLTPSTYKWKSHEIEEEDHLIIQLCGSARAIILQLPHRSVLSAAQHRQSVSSPVNVKFLLGQNCAPTRETTASLTRRRAPIGRTEAVTSSRFA